MCSPLEIKYTESWHKIKNSQTKESLFAESVERHFGMQNDNFDSKHFDEVNQFIEDNYEYFILLKTSMSTERTWMMITILWPVLTLIHPLGYLCFLSEVKPQAPTTYTMRFLG